MQECIGIIAGSGQFPRLVAEGAREQGLCVVACGFYEHTDQALSDCVDAFTMVHLGQFGKVIDFFRAHGARRLCMAGAISKPRALSFRPDFRAAKMLFSLRRKGDDALLRAIMNELEHEGFSVVPASSFATSLHSPTGVLTRRSPTPEEYQNIAYGWSIAKTLGEFDIGQCLVVRDGMVVAVECLEGTDATLRRGAALGGEHCLAIKRTKPGQDERADLPSVGLETIRLLVDNRFSCLAVEAGKTLFFDREEALALADKHDLCVIALDSQTPVHSSHEC